MNFNKYWLLKQLELNLDVINNIKDLSITIVKPPTYQELKSGLKGNIYIKDRIVIESEFDVNTNFYKHKYDYIQTNLFIKNGKISEIYFDYMMEGTLYDYTFKLMELTIENITLYKYDDLYYFNNDNELVKTNKITIDGLYSIIGDVIFVA